MSFDNNSRDLAATLSAMEQRSREMTNFNQPAARQKMTEWVSNDRRFDSYDPDKLVDRVAHCKAYGARLDLDAVAEWFGGRDRLQHQQWLRSDGSLCRRCDEQARHYEGNEGKSLGQQRHRVSLPIKSGARQSYQLPDVPADFEQFSEPRSSVQISYASVVVAHL